MLEHLQSYKTFSSDEDAIKVRCGACWKWFPKKTLVQIPVPDSKTGGTRLEWFCPKHFSESDDEFDKLYDDI